MDLPDGSRGQRLRVDRREDVLPRDAELLLHHVDDLRLRQRRDLVLELGELVGDVRWDQVGPGREDLAELREGRPELLERVPEGLRAGRRRGSGAGVEPEPGEPPSDLRGPADQPSLDLRLGRRLGDDVARGVDDHDGAPRGVRDPVWHVAEEELLAAGHASVPDDEDVRTLLLGGSDDGRRDVGIDAHERPRVVERGLLRPELRLGAVSRLRQHLQEHELAVRAAAQVVGPAHRLGGGLGAVGGDDDLHAERLFQHSACGESRRRRPVPFV